jgi:hypothetical protein
MQQGILGALSLLDVRGYVIIATIVVTVLSSICFTLFIRGRYAAFARDLSEHTHADRPFSHRVLTRILEDARTAHARQQAADHQARIEQHFDAELGGLLLGERFVRAAPGLVIIFGLVGTFYGLSMSIGKLVRLVAGGGGEASDIGATMTQGLTQALTGMSVAFSTSLFGIASAIVLTFFGVFFNVTDRRTALMVAVENHLDRLLGPIGAGAAGTLDGGLVQVHTANLEQIFADFARSVEDLRDSVGRFDASLQGFAANTRDFREFNLHLKDNVQRMSLSFADVSETLRNHASSLAARPHR